MIFWSFCLLFMGFILSFINTFKNSVPGALLTMYKQVERAVPTSKPTFLGTCPGHLRPLLSTPVLSGEAVEGRGLSLYFSFVLKHGSRVPGPESGLRSSQRWRDIWAVYSFLYFFVKDERPSVKETIPRIPVEDSRCRRQVDFFLGFCPSCLVLADIWAC